MRFGCLLSFGRARFQSSSSQHNESSGKLEIEHCVIPVSAPYREGYTAALRRIRDDFSVSAVVTGDIDLVDGRPNWIRECSVAIDLDVLTPLWQQDRERLLWDVVNRGIIAQVSWINHGARCPFNGSGEPSTRNLSMIWSRSRERAWTFAPRMESITHVSPATSAPSHRKLTRICLC